MEDFLFKKTSRQEFRRRFQPSRIAICVVPERSNSKVNLITLSFNMHCSYRPPMMAFSINRRALSYELLNKTEHSVLSVPGERLADTALFCGTHSGRDVDKVKACDLSLINSETICIPGISQAIANIELKIVARVPTGDHMTLFGRVLKFGVNKENKERCLVSVGPDYSGYELLATKGIHRIAVASRETL